jgi:hypothetical protein
MALPLLMLLIYGRSGQNLRLSGGDPPNPPRGRRRLRARSAAHALGCTRARLHTRSAAHALGCTRARLHTGAPN